MPLLFNKELTLVIYTLKRIGLKQLPCGRPRYAVQCTIRPEGEIKVNNLLEKSLNKKLQIFEGTPISQSLFANVGICTESKALLISTNVALRNSLSQKD